MSNVLIKANKESRITKTNIDALELDRLYACEEAFIFMITQGMPKNFTALCQILIAKLIVFQKDEAMLKSLLAEADNHLFPLGDSLLEKLNANSGKSKR